VKGLFGYSAIALDEIAALEVRDGELRVKRKGALLTDTVSAARIANLHALMAVLAR